MKEGSAKKWRQNASTSWRFGIQYMTVAPASLVHTACCSICSTPCERQAYFFILLLALKRTVFIHNMIIKLQLILKMTVFCSYACSQMNAPLLNCTLDNDMVECSPLFSQSLLQMCDISYVHFVHTFLHDAPDFVVNRIEIRAVWWPLQWCDECWRLPHKHLNSFLCAMCRSTTLLKDK